MRIIAVGLVALIVFQAGAIGYWLISLGTSLNLDFVRELGYWIMTAEKNPTRQTIFGFIILVIMGIALVCINRLSVKSNKTIN